MKSSMKIMAALDAAMATAAKIDTASIDAAMAAAAKIDTASIDAAMAAAAKIDTARLDAAMAAVARIDTTRIDAAMTAVAGIDTTRIDAAMAAVARIDTTRDAAMAVAAGIDTTRIDAAMAVAAKIDTARIDVAMAMIPQLAQDLFGDAWNERLAAAVGRLGHAEDIIRNAPEPERAIKELVEDAATLQEAAPPKAQKSVNMLVHQLTWGLIVQIIAGPELAAAGAAVREVVLSLLVTLLVATTPPDLPPAPGLLMSHEIKPVTTALTLPGDWAVEGLPAIVQRAGPAAAERLVEFFTAQIRNPNTRAAYGTAVTRFFTWCDARGLELNQISPIAVATYIEAMQDTASAPTVKQHLAALRHLFDWLVVGQILPTNPASSVRGPTHIVKTGKTPVLQPDEARELLASIDSAILADLRDRALLAVMVYSFARVSAVVRMDVEDYYQQGKRWWLRLHEKGGKYHALPVHHTAEAYLDAYLDAAGIAGATDTPLWRTMTRGRELSGRRMSRVDVFRMIKRRVKAAGLGAAANCHTFRATGITAFLLNGGTLERAQAIAAHESPRTTKLYDRTADEVTIEDIEKIGI